MWQRKNLNENDLNRKGIPKAFKREVENLVRLRVHESMYQMLQNSIDKMREILRKFIFPKFLLPVGLSNFVIFSKEMENGDTRSRKNNKDV